MKIVINTDYGGFQLSGAVYKLLRANKPDDWRYEINRTDPELVKYVELLGTDANGEIAKLKVVEIPDGSHYFIEDYDGIETVHFSKSEIHSVD